MGRSRADLVGGAGPSAASPAVGFPRGPAHTRGRPVAGGWRPPPRRGRRLGPRLAPRGAPAGSLLRTVTRLAVAWRHGRFLSPCMHNLFVFGALRCLL